MGWFFLYFWYMERVRFVRYLGPLLADLEIDIDDFLFLCCLRGDFGSFTKGEFEFFEKRYKYMFSDARKYVISRSCFHRFLDSHYIAKSVKHDNRQYYCLSSKSNNMISSFERKCLSGKVPGRKRKINRGDPAARALKEFTKRAKNK